MNDMRLYAVCSTRIWDDTEIVYGNESQKGIRIRIAI